ncbi:hypothetical protein VNO78_22008 [Psophocarpus tetragonolobus]|uniref:Uncharacterized protein n=1 Tax=Psophocarpus tetragonolobus TaxID=3891 RepID=A0AAN9SCK6_PSOTE
MGRPPSTIEIPRECHRHNGRGTTDSDGSDDYSRPRSPSYDSYDRHADSRRRLSESPGLRNPRHSDRTHNDNALPRKFGRRNGAYVDRERGDWQRSDSESDEELKKRSDSESDKELKKFELRGIPKAQEAEDEEVPQALHLECYSQSSVAR